MEDVRTGEKIRLLYCRTCNSIEELPDYDGPPEHDTLLQVLAQRHTTPAGDKHIGNLFDVEVDLWAKPEVRKKVIEQIKGGSKGLDECDENFYDTRSTFYEDAMACYAKHLRPEGACPDWMSDSKVLLPDTKAERKDAGLERPSKAPGAKIHLCNFCPVQRYYSRKSNEAKGIQ